MFFNIGSENNGVARDGNGNVILDGNGNPTYQLTTDPVSASGLIGGTLLGDSIYMVTLQDNSGTPVLSNLTRIASGVRNAASMAIDPAGDLFFADNGIDGNGGGKYGWSTDELDEIPAAQIGGPTEFFGFPEMINGQLAVSYVKTNAAPGDPVTVVNPGVGVQPLIAFEPLPDSNLAPLGSRSQGASGFALSPPQFPAGLNTGVFIGFHGDFDTGGIANDQEPTGLRRPEHGPLLRLRLERRGGRRPLRRGRVHLRTRSSSPTSRRGATWGRGPARGRSTRSRRSRARARRRPRRRRINRPCSRRSPTRRWTKGSR